MGDRCDSHNAVLFPMLKLITQAAGTEEGQWVILESLCLGIGKLHNRSPRQTAIYVETIAERLTTGEKT